MVLLREAQIRHNVEDATKMVCDDLAQSKSNSSLGPNKPILGILPDDFSLDVLKPPTAGQKFTTSEVNEKLRKAFFLNTLKDVKFEFGLFFSPNGDLGYMERQSANFTKMYDDSLTNFTCTEFVNTPGGSASGNLSSDEVLIVVIPNIKNLVVQTLRWNIVTAILFSIIIIAAFYLTVRTMLASEKNQVISKMILLIT